MADKSFDPRYDPIFQRGHEGGVVRQRVAVEPPSLTTESTPAPHISEPAPREPAKSPGRGPVKPELARPVVTTEILGEQPVPVNRGRMPNPFIALLWLAGPGLIALGAGSSYRFFGSQFSGPVREDDVILQQLIWMLSPSMVTAGLAIIAGLLFWHAFRWQSRRALSPDDDVATRRREL